MTTRRPSLTRDYRRRPKKGRLVRDVVAINASRSGSTTCRAPVAHRLRPVLEELARLSSPRTVREWNFLTLRQWAGVLAVFGHKADRKTINHWELGDRRVPDAAFAAYAAAIAWRVGIDSDVKLEAHLTPKWRVTVRRICDKCGKPFQFKRVTDRFCKRCRR